jgi:hypothetical protein
MKNIPVNRHITGWVGGFVNNHLGGTIVGKNNAIVDVTIATVMIHRWLGGMRSKEINHYRCYLLPFWLELPSSKSLSRFQKCFASSPHSV